MCKKAAKILISVFLKLQRCKIILYLFFLVAELLLWFLSCSNLVVKCKGEGYKKGLAATASSSENRRVFEGRERVFLSFFDFIPFDDGALRTDTDAARACRGSCTTCSTDSKNLDIVSFPDASEDEAVERDNGKESDASDEDADDMETAALFAASLTGT